MSIGCFQWFKDTKMKANHNVIELFPLVAVAVSNGSKILKWKQITTNRERRSKAYRCFQWFKDTKMKANHNGWFNLFFFFFAVSNGSKILKWKQITTGGDKQCIVNCCFQWFKDTKMKANHNVCVRVCVCISFPKIVNLNKNLSDFPTIWYLYTFFFIHEYWL